MLRIGLFLLFGDATLRVMVECCMSILLMTRMHDGEYGMVGEDVDRITARWHTI
jgi:hypothetical protein